MSGKKYFVFADNGSPTHSMQANLSGIALFALGVTVVHILGFPFPDGGNLVCNHQSLSLIHIWLLNLNYIDFLREVGVHFSVNRMLSFECYKQRLERGLSFFELNYMLMQSYDFLELNHRYNCMMEMCIRDRLPSVTARQKILPKCAARRISLWPQSENRSL